VKWVNLQLAWLALPVLALAYLVVRERLHRKGIMFSNLAPFAKARRTLAARLRFLPMWLRILALALITVAVIRPTALMGEEEVKLRGVNIMLVVDLSGSMVAEDLKPDRITAEKKVLSDFVNQSQQDQVGVVVFGAKSFTQSPLTLDHEVLASAIKEMDLSTVDADGTAIGDGILTAVNRLSEFPGKTNVIVLSTDGTNNRGEDPLKAVEIAATRKVRIYAIGIGAKGGAPIYTQDQFGVKRPYIVDGKPANWEEPNDKLMEQMAAKTGGEYFRATDEKSLAAVYGRISKLIKDEKKRKDPHYRELFFLFLGGACLALFLESLLAATWLRSLT
jgi:Ca-activated chloride channel family protein